MSSIWPLEGLPSAEKVKVLDIDIVVSPLSLNKGSLKKLKKKQLIAVLLNNEYSRTVTLKVSRIPWATINNCIGINDAHYIVTGCSADYTTLVSVKRTSSDKFYLNTSEPVYALYLGSVSRQF